MITIDYGRWEVKTPAVNKPLTLNDFKSFRNIDITDTSFDIEYQLYIDSAINLIEKYLNYNLLNTTWYYYLKSFNNINSHCLSQINSEYFTIYNKGNINQIIDINYLKNNIWTLIADTEYKFIKKPIKCIEYDIYAKTAFPNDYDLFNNFQIEILRIQLISGFGINATDIPAEIRLALIQLASKLYDTKGQCDKDCNCINPVLDSITHYRAEKYIL
jgi:hypothetical protein